MMIFTKKLLLPLLFLIAVFSSHFAKAQCVAGFTSTPGAPIVGCDPFNVLFNSNTTGTVVNRLWNFGNGVTSTAQNPSQVFTANLSDTIYYCFLAIECSGGLRDTVYFQVTVRARPRATFTASKTSVCALTDSVCFTNTSSTGAGYAYNWDFGDFTSSTQFSPCKKYSTPGTYQARLTVTNNYGCTRQTTQTITVNDIPNTNFNVSSTAGCTPFTVSFTNNTVAGTSPIVSWEWDYGDASTPTVLQNSPPHTYFSTGTYTITLRATNTSGCSNINTRTVIVSNTPTASISAPTNICQGEPASISYSGTASPAGTYNWGFAGGTLNSGSGQGPLSVTWNSSGTKTISLTVINTNGCSTSTSKSINVYPKPTINLTSSKDTVCEGDTVVFTVSPSGYAQNLFYNGGTLLATQAQNVYSVNSFLLSSLIRARVLDSNGCYSDFDTSAVYVKPTPSLTISKSPNNDTLCNGVPITSTASPNTYGQYIFRVGFANVQGGPSNTYTSSSIPSNTPVSVSAINNGCSGLSSNSISTTILQRLPSPQVYCGTGTTSSITFQWNAVSGAVGYKVSVNGAAFVNPSSGSNGLIHILTGLNQGDSALIRVVAFDNSICNYGDTSLPFKCYALPCTPVSLTITPSKSLACDGESFSVSLSNFSVPKYSISWDSLVTFTGLTFYNYTAQAGKSYYIYIYDSAQTNCPPTQRLVPITVNPVPTVTLTKSPNVSTICANSTITFTASPQTYSIYRFYNGTTLLQQGPNPVYTTNNLPSGNSIRVVAVNNNCTSPASNALSTTVITSTAVTLNSSIATDTVCQGDGVTFTASPGTYQTYNFYNGSNLLQSGNGNQITISNWTIPNSIYVIALDASGCNTDTSNVFSYFVRVTPSITLTSSINGDSICVGQSAAFSISPSGLALYRFLINGNVVQSGSSSTFNTTSLADSQIVTARAGVTGCPPVSQSNAIMARVKSPINAPTVSCGTTTNSTIQFVWNAVSGAIGYQVSVNGSPFNYPNTGQTGTSHIISGLSPGDSATIVVRALSGSPCDTSARSAPVKCYSIPCSPISFSKSTLPSNICIGDSVFLYITNISTNNYGISWEGGAVGSDTTFRIKVLTDTIISVELKDNNQSACPTASNSFNIVTSKTPGITISSNAPAFGVCEGSAVTFTVTSINSSYVYSNYKFYNGSTLIQNGSSNVLVTTALQPGNSIYAVATSNSCQDISNTLSLNVIPKQKIFVTSNVSQDSICRGVPVTYTLSPTSYQRFRFFNNVSLMQDSTLNTITVSTLNNPNRIFGQAEDINGCLSEFSDTISKFIYPATSVSLVSTAPQDTICELKPVSFVAAPSGYSNYEFFVDFASVQNSSSNVYTANNFNTSHFVKVVSRNAFGCYDTSQVNYKITVISRLPAPNAYCGNTTLTSIEFRWDALTNAGGYLVSINGGPFITPSSGPTGLTHYIGGLNTGDSATIRVLAYNFNSPCVYGDTSLLAKCFALPCNFVGFNAVSSVPEACAGDTVEFSVNGVTTGNFSVSFNNQTTYQTKTYDSIAVALSTTYRVYLVDSNQLTCPPFFRNVAITVNPIPTVSLTSDEDTICETETVNFTASPAGYENYKYYNNATLVQDSGLHLYGTPFLQPGNSVVVVATDKGCSVTSSPVNVLVIPAQKLNITNSTVNDTACYQSSITFNANPASYTNYKFYNSGVLLQNNASSSFTSSTIANGNRIYFVASDAFGCEIHYSDTDNIYIKPFTSISINSSAILNKVCQGDTLLITAFPANAFQSYRFYWNNSLTQDSAINQKYLYNLVDGDSVITIGVDSNGCNATSNTIRITVQQRPGVTVFGDTLVCQGDTATITANPTQPFPGITYQWLSGETQQIIKPVPSVTTTYTVVASVNGCPGQPASHSVVVDALPKPVADAGNARIGCIGDTVILRGTGGQSFSWQPVNKLVSPNTDKPTFFVDSTTIFTLTVTNIKCSSIDTITIFADKCLDDVYFIPQIITVNGDGVNDFFFIPDIDYFPNNTVKIYNRWGDEVYSAHPYNNTFDGKGVGGKELPEGVYYYVVDVANGKGKVHKGMFIIQR